MISRKEKRIYGDVIKHYRPTIRTLIIQILEAKLFNLRRRKEPIYHEGSKFFPETDRLANMNLTYIAVIKNDTVQEMIRVNEESAKILLSKSIKFVEFDPKETIVKKGMKYKEKSFVEDNNEES